MQREIIAFPSDGLKLSGWLYLPANRTRKVPVVVMAHGFGAVKEQYLDRFAEVFAQAGLAALVFDYRNFGESEGQPRQEVDPWEQIRDWRNAISYARSRPELDGERLGIWGASFGGGHALVVGAIDRRVKCVVAMVPTISGYESWLRRVPPEMQPVMEATFAADQERVYRGEPGTMQPLSQEEKNGKGQYRSREALEFFARPESRPATWRNEVTLRSVEMARNYEPGSYIRRISPTPLMMILSDRDVVTLTDLALKAYEAALEPKKLVLLPGEHFSPNTTTFSQASSAARDWLVSHLSAPTQASV